MTPRAARIVARRKQRKAAAEKHYQQDTKAEQRRDWQLARAERARPKTALDFARALFQNLAWGDEAARTEARRRLAAAPEEVRAAVQEMAGANSEWKQRRSRQRNGF